VTQIIINHSDRVSNVHALDAVTQFININIARKNIEPYCKTREITINDEINVIVKELEHDNEAKSPCSVVFEVTKLL
jgi:hypothetical protein